MTVENWEILLNLPFNIMGLLFTYWFARKFYSNQSLKISSPGLSRYPHYNLKFALDYFSFSSIILAMLLLPVQGGSDGLYFPIALISIYFIRLCVEFSELNESRNYKRVRYLYLEGILLTIVALQLKIQYGNVDPVSIMMTTLGMRFKFKFSLLVKLTTFLVLLYLLVRSNEAMKSSQIKRGINTKLDIAWSYLIKTSIIFLFLDGSAPFEIFDLYFGNSKIIIFVLMLLSFLIKLVLIELLTYIIRFSVTRNFFGLIESKSEKLIITASILGLLINIWT